MWKRQPLEFEYVKSTQLGSCLCLVNQPIIKKLAGDKHSSLFCTAVSFIVLTIGLIVVGAIKTFLKDKQSQLISCFLCYNFEACAIQLCQTAVSPTCSKLVRLSLSKTTATVWHMVLKSILSRAMFHRHNKLECLSLEILFSAMYLTL